MGTKRLLKAVSTDEKEKDYILQFAMENCWITDYQAYFAQSKAILNADCREDTELLCLSYENREKLCKEFHSLEHFLEKSKLRFCSITKKRMLSFMVNDSKKRYDLLLVQYPALFQRVSKAIIALYLGFSRETLSRLNK